MQIRNDLSCIRTFEVVAYGHWFRRVPLQHSLKGASMTVSKACGFLVLMALGSFALGDPPCPDYCGCTPGACGAPVSQCCNTPIICSSMTQCDVELEVTFGGSYEYAQNSLPDAPYCNGTCDGLCYNLQYMVCGFSYPCHVTEVGKCTSYGDGVPQYYYGWWPSGQPCCGCTE